MKKELQDDFLRLRVVVVFESFSSTFNTAYNETFRFILFTLNGILQRGHFVDFAALPQFYMQSRQKLWPHLITCGIVNRLKLLHDNEYQMAHQSSFAIYSISIQQSATLKPRERKLTETTNQPVIYPVDNYKLLELINIGGYGCVHKAIETKTSQLVAIKYSKQSMEKEYKILAELQIPGIPKVHTYGQMNNTHYFVMEFIQDDIGSIVLKLKQLSKKTLLLLAIKFIQVLTVVHKHGIKHRDIKPQNLMINYSDPTIYLIDFGISLSKTDPQTNSFIEGTILYDSRNVHKRQNYRYIDDLEMFAYCITELYKGQLPWEKYIDGRESRIQQLKQDFIDSNSTQQLFFYPIFQFINDNQNDEIPNYEPLIAKLRQVLKNDNLEEDYQYDWKKLEQINTAPSLQKQRTVSFMSKFAPEQADLKIAQEGLIQFVDDQSYKFMK